MEICRSLPLYRQEELLVREGIIIPRQTLSNWVLRSGLALQPLYKEMKKPFSTIAMYL
jgi:transposase